MQKRCGRAQADAAIEERKAEVRRKLRERAVPASPLGRAFGFARLGANLVYGTVSDSVSRYIRGPPPGGETGAEGGKGSNRCALMGHVGACLEMFSAPATCVLFAAAQFCGHA